MEIDTSILIKSPEVTFDYDKQNESLDITVEMPGVHSENEIDLKISVCGFCVSAKTDNIQYKGCYKFFHEVDTDEAKINFEHGTLSLVLPFFEPICGKQYPLDMDTDEDL